MRRAMPKMWEEAERGDGGMPYSSKDSCTVKSHRPCALVVDLNFRKWMILLGYLEGLKKLVSPQNEV